jgi:tRNA-splicing ligase RtcB
VIHRHVARALGVRVLLDVENHHNFAWRERHVLSDGSQDELIVHRKGATPAGEGVLGIIPGSMGTPGYVVRGKGVAASLNSASHGAGRRMSRKKAKETFSWDAVQAFLRKRNVTLISAGSMRFRWPTATWDSPQTGSSPRAQRRRSPPGS